MSGRFAFATIMRLVLSVPLRAKLLLKRLPALPPRNVVGDDDAPEGDVRSAIGLSIVPAPARPASERLCPFRLTVTPSAMVTMPFARQSASALNVTSAEIVSSAMTAAAIRHAATAANFTTIELAPTSFMTCSFLNFTYNIPSPRPEIKRFSFADGKHFRQQ